VAAFVAVSIERILAAYKNILDIREARQHLAKSKVPDAALADIDQHANSRMRDEIKAYVEEALDAHDRIHKERTNELRADLTRSLNGLANRIDKGYDIDIRVVPAETEDEQPEDEDTAQAVQTILAAAPSLKFLNRTGQPILELPESSLPEGSDVSITDGNAPAGK
jgi:hypothetical protein